MNKKEIMMGLGLLPEDISDRRPFWELEPNDQSADTSSSPSDALNLNKNSEATTSCLPRSCSAKAKWFKDILIKSGAWGKGFCSVSQLVQNAELVDLDYFYTEPIPETFSEAKERLSSLNEEILEKCKVKFAGRLVWGNSPYEEDDERSKIVCRKTPRLWFKLEE